MRRFTIILLALLVVCFIGLGCKSKSGSREYTPGQGWKEIPD